MFSVLIDEINVNGYSEVYEWLDFKKKYGIETNLRTVDVLAVDDYSKLDMSLKKNKFTIYRLGTHAGSRAHFAIVRYKDIVDHYIFNDTCSNYPAEVFFPHVPAREIFSFAVIPNATENGLVNLAIASGILEKALGLSSRPTLPAKGNSTYSFDVMPSRDFPELILRHCNGQVEIDSAFLGTVNGEDRVFVVEAKMAKGRKSISKTKLAYSYLAVRSRLKLPIKIELVYLLIDRPSEDYIQFTVCPCKWEGGYITDLMVDEHRITNYLLPSRFGF